VKPPFASPPPCWKNLWPTGATGRSLVFAPEIEAREGVRISRSQLSKALRKKSSVGGGRGTP
jgi:hypothetical protein